ncbi:unnamed protein product [Rhizophagus irregularis]|nr:unnamed protein product [Rhizophagus irregularis]
MLATACKEDAIWSIYDKMPLRTCGHNTIDIIEIVIPKRLICESENVDIYLACCILTGNVLLKHYKYILKEILGETEIFSHLTKPK